MSAVRNGSSAESRSFIAVLFPAFGKRASQVFGEVVLSSRFVLLFLYIKYQSWVSKDRFTEHRVSIKFVQQHLAALYAIYAINEFLLVPSPHVLHLPNSHNFNIFYTQKTPPELALRARQQFYLSTTSAATQTAGFSYSALAYLSFTLWLAY